MQNNDQDNNVYIPGVCNIGKEEIKKRRNAAILNGILSVIVVTVLLVTHADRLWRFLVFIPLTGFGVGVQQWYTKFCVNFGMRGLFNFKNLGQVLTVDQAEMRKADKSKAIRMIVTGILFGLVLTVIFYFVA